MASSIDNRPDALAVTAVGGFMAWYPDAGKMSAAYDDFNDARRAAHKRIGRRPVETTNASPEIYEGRDVEDGRPIPGRVPVAFWMPWACGGRGRWCKSPDWYRDMARR